MVGELVVKKQNFQTMSGLVWLPEFSFLVEVRGGSIGYNPKALRWANRKLEEGTGGNGSVGRRACFLV